MTVENSEILTITDVMNLLGISRSTVHRKKKSGELVSYKLGKKIYFKHSEILAAVEAGKEINEETAVQKAA